MAIVESALVLPLVLLLSFAILEYGWMFVQYEHVTGIAQRAARLASLPGTTSGDKVESDAIGWVNEIRAGAAAQVTVSDVNVSPGNDIRVTIRVPYGTEGSLTHFSLLPVPTAFSATVTAAKEG